MMSYQNQYKQQLSYNFQNLMKNSLQLEITTMVKKANFFFAKQKYSQSLALVDEALIAFIENKHYNHSVSPLLESLLYSIRGRIHFELKQFDKAESDFHQSLLINPFDSLTLIRRAKLYHQTNQLPQALQDLERALICDPSADSLENLKNSIGKSIEDLENGQQKQRLSKNLMSIVNFICFEEEEEQNEQERILSFSNLKKIDRQSFSNNSNKVSKFNSFQSELQDQKVEQISDRFASEQASNFQDQNELNPVCIIQKNISKKKPKPLSISNLRSVPVKLGKKKLMSCQESYKSIDGTLERRSSVKFLDNANNSICSQKGFEKKCEENLQKPTKRKSCLRTSNIKCEDLPNLIHRKSSSFMEIKNIDGALIPSSFSNINEQTNSKRDNDTNYQNQKQFSDSDEENSEYNIYGQKSRTSKILQCLQNLNNWSGKKIQNKHEKKRSILKKSSLVGSEPDTPEPRHTEHKKSVCFQDCESPTSKS